MRQNILRRLLESFVVLAGVAFLIFIMLRIIPGNPVETMMGEHANQATIARMTAELGLDQPIHIQFVRFIADALRGDFGTSYSLGKPVSGLMALAFINTLKLSLLACAFAWILGIICGIISAVWKNRRRCGRVRAGQTDRPGCRPDTCGRRGFCPPAAW